MKYKQNNSKENIILLTSKMKQRLSDKFCLQKSDYKTKRVSYVFVNLRRRLSDQLHNNLYIRLI